MSTNLGVDELIECKLERMAAKPPLGGVIVAVYGLAGSPNEPAGILDEAGDLLSTYIDDDLKANGISLDARTLAVLAKIVATAMIKQHEFTQSITSIALLGAGKLMRMSDN
jgi:hypothetical protein